MFQGKKIIYLAFLAPAIMIIAGLWYWRTPAENLAAPGGLVKQINLSPNPLLLYPALNQYPAKPAEAPGAKALIVPHHDLASKLAAEAMSKISSNRVKTVILIGPNHENRGAGKIITAEAEWRSELGDVQTEIDIVRDLKEENLAAHDAERLAGEHSINTLIPFIKNYFPRAKVAPIILNHDLGEATADQLADFIFRRADEKTLIIGSLDFSHYLPTLEANANDKITEQAIKDDDYEEIFSFSDGFVDSPITLVTLMKTAKLLGASAPRFINHANSAGLTNAENVLSSTSYFTILFGQK